MTAILGGVVQQGLGNACGSMDLRKMVAPFDVMVVLMVGLFKINTLICAEDGFTEDGGRRLLRCVHGYSLRVC
jgi:hypothetical protein